MAGSREAALKAWKTIRKNKAEQAEKRHNAAVKANVTRGKTGRKAAAKKAWETRKSIIVVPQQVLIQEFGRASRRAQA